MPPTSRVIEPRGRRAFTLVEMIVVCAVLVIIAAAIVPNLVAITRSRSLKDLEAGVARLPLEARNEALQTHTPVRLRVSGTTLVMERVPVGGDPQLALKSGTFAPGTIGDPTAKGNSCDDANDAQGCIFTQNLLVDDATAAEISAAVAGVSTASGSSSSSGSNNAGSSDASTAAG